MENNCCGFSCPVEATIQLIGGKYKAVILWHLMNKTLRYNEIHKLIPKASVIFAYSAVAVCVLFYIFDR